GTVLHVNGSLCIRWREGCQNRGCRSDPGLAEVGPASAAHLAVEGHGGRKASRFRGRATRIPNEGLDVWCIEGAMAPSMHQSWDRPIACRVVVAKAAETKQATRRAL